MAGRAELTVVAACPATLVADPLTAGEAEVRAAGVAAAAAGFDAASAWAHHIPALEGLGLPVTVVETAMRWANSDSETALAEANHLASVVVSTGATKLTAICLEPSIIDLDTARRNLSTLVQINGEAGAQVCVEFLPWSGIPDLATAWTLVEPLGDGAGILLDTWHWIRQPGGPALDLLLTIPGARLGYIQLCDAGAQPGPDLLTEAMTGRLLPGEGVVDFDAIVSVLAAIDAHPVVATEIFNPGLLASRGVPAAAAAMKAAAEDVVRRWSAPS